MDTRLEIDGEDFVRELVRPLTAKGRGAASNEAGRFEAERREACDDGWEIIAPQLDNRHRPCNLVELMPRLKEHLTAAR